MSGRVYLRLGRISNLPTVWTNVLAGVVLAGGRPEPATVLALLLSLSLFYEGGMFLNDAFDRHFDARERPERPIPAGQISAARVFVLGFGMLAVALAVLALAGSGAATGAGVVLAGVITYYNVHHKGNPASPLVMGVCRALVYVVAALATTGRVAAAVWIAVALVLAYLIGLTYVAKQETLAEFRRAWPLLFLLAPFAVTLPATARSAGTAVVWAAFLAWVIHATTLLRRGRANIPRAVVSLIAGISLLDALLVTGAGAPGLGLICVGAFGLTLLLQRWVSGT